MIDLSSRRAALPSLSYRIFGIGGAGVQVLERLKQSGAAPASLVALDTDQRQLAASVAGEKITLGCKAAGGLGTGGDPELGRTAFEENRSEIGRIADGANLVFILGGLGGGTASGALSQVAREARERGAMTVAVVTLPFAFEGKRRIAQAEAALAELEGAADLVLCFENDRMSESVSPSAGIDKAFIEADRMMADSVISLIDLLGGEGLIHFSYGDLKAALPGVRARALFGYGMAEGANRPFDALARALRGPLMDKGRMLAECDTVIAQVSGGPEMTLHEVELLMQELNGHVGEGTQILFGTSATSRLAGWMSVTLIAAIRLPEEKAPAAPVMAPAVVAPTAPVVSTSPFAVVEGGAHPVELGLKVIKDEAQLEGLAEFEELAPRVEKVSPPVATPPPSFIQEETEVLEPTAEITEESPKAPEAQEISDTVKEAEVSSSPFDQSLVRRSRAVRPQPGRELFSMTGESAEAEEASEASSLNVPAASVVEGEAEVDEEIQVSPSASYEAPSELIPPHLPEPQVVEEEMVAPETEEETVEASASEWPESSEADERPEVGGADDEPAAQAPASVVVPSTVVPPKEKVPTQGTLKFEPIARGRFEKSEPTIVDGEDLDIPTYLRRNLRIRLRS